MATLRDVIVRKKEYDKKFASEQDIFRGKIVAVEQSGGGLSAEVAGKPGFVWVVSESGNAWEVFNRKVRTLIGLDVLVGRSPKPPNRWEILQWDDSLIVNDPNYDGSPYLKNHHRDHEQWDTGFGGDAVDVYTRMLVPLRTYVSEDASETNPVTTIGVASLLWVNGFEFIGFNGNPAFDISSYLPLAGYKCWILVYLDRDTNTIGAKAGTQVPNISTNVPPYPTVEANSVTSALILADNPLGTWNAQIYDARMCIKGTSYPPAEETGQLLFSVDGATFEPFLPCMTPTGLVVDDKVGVMIVCDKHGS